MRFYSHWIHVLWLYRLVNAYYPFQTKQWNTAVLVMYSITAGCDYSIRMYKVWESRAHAVNQSKVADQVSIAEFFFAFLASLGSGYWLLDNLIPPWLWLVFLGSAWTGHVVLQRRWKFYFDKLRQSAYSHVPSDPL